MDPDKILVLLKNKKYLGVFFSGRDRGKKKDNPRMYLFVKEPQGMLIINVSSSPMKMYFVKRENLKRFIENIARGRQAVILSDSATYELVKKISKLIKGS
jgi:hypothetical protein